MKPEEQIKALAELDGWKGLLQDPVQGHRVGYKEPDRIYTGEHIPNYLTSYDAIIPLIQKQNHAIKMDVQFSIINNELLHDCYSATPSQLCKALLRATGKWKE